VLFLGYIYPGDIFIPRAKFIFIPGYFLARELNIGGYLFSTRDKKYPGDTFEDKPISTGFASFCRLLDTWTDMEDSADLLGLSRGPSLHVR